MMHVLLSSRLICRARKTHLAIWLAWIVFHWVIFPQFDDGLDYWENYLAFFFVHMLLFYAHAGVLLPWLNKYPTCWRLLPVFILLEFAAYFLLFLSISLLFGDLRIAWEERAALFDIHNVKPFIRPFLDYLGFATLLFVVNKFYTERLSFVGIALKRQISVHFLVNFLQGVYRIFKVGTREEGVTKVLWLQEYAAFLLKKEETPQPIEKEVEALRNLLRMESARKSTFSFSLVVDEAALSFTLIPMVLLTLAENILQHGEVLNPAFAAEMYISIQEGAIWIKTRNKIRAQGHGGGSGIGLKNLAERLAMQYKDKYRLEYSEKDGFFELTLTVRMKD